jgi:exonuclease SbcC
VLAKTCEEAQAKIAFVKDMGSLNEVSMRLESVKKAQTQSTDLIAKAQENLSASFAEKQKQEGLLGLLENTLRTEKQAIESALFENGFAKKEEVEILLNRVGDKDKAEKETQAFFDAYGACLHKIKEADVTQFSDFNEQTMALVQAEKNEASDKVTEINKTVGAWEKELLRLQALHEKYKEQEKELAKKEAWQKLCDELKQLVRSNKFLEFIASEYLQEICTMATTTLLSLTNGRYFLQYDKDFRVGDNLDGGNVRSVKTLSGGETFLVSLSLALSLSNTICMKSLRPIEFFFLDEGFGTLDEKLVETVMDVLGKLSKKFAVGLISHVEELKHRIESKLIVTGATEKHGSIVRTEIL